MKLLRTLACLAGALALASTADAQTLELRNGQWFDGAAFAPRTMYVYEGVLTSEAPAGIDSTIDLAGGYVVPPFGEAHNHNVESSRAEAVIARYLREGIFYVKNPNSLPKYTEPLRELINHPRGIDVTFAGGGLTSEGGHPVAIATRMIGYGVWDESDGEGGFYYTLDSREELDARWESILEKQPDFLKTYLLYSEEYEQRRADSAFVDWRGLDPAMLPEIVERAHDAGLRVTTHVETATDFHHAVQAGVDEINHMPGFRPDSLYETSSYTIAEADARKAAAAGIVVVTTVSPFIEALERAEREEIGEAKIAAYREMLEWNLRVLHENGVTLAIGSDRYDLTALSEAVALQRFGAFDNATLLRLWCENTAQAIFPDRKIGRLADGYEASFLVLDGNPIEDFSAVERIRTRVKQGVLLPDVEASE